MTINWNDTIKKEARGINGEDLGEIQEILNDDVVVERGAINKDKFFIPKDMAESYDGSTVIFNITADDIAKSKYTGSSYPRFDETT